MPLKTDFDRRAYWNVLAHALGGVVLGVIPGAVLISAIDDRVSANTLGAALLTLGGIAGAVAGGTAAAAACIVAAIRHRGTGPGKARLRDYQQPEPLPQIPPPRKPVPPAAAASPPDTDTVPQSAAPGPPTQPSPVPRTPRHDAQLFEDYDR